MIAGLRSYLEALPHEAALKPLPIFLASVLAAVVAVLVRLSTTTAPRNLHTLNPKGAFEISDRRVKAEFQRDATRMLRDWFSKNPDKPVVINGDMGAVTVLPPSMANEIRNDPRLSFIEFTMEMFHSHLHGFEPFALGQSDDMVQSIVRKDLTKQLAKVTGALVEETSLALRDILTDSTEWHEANVRQTIQPLIARISSRVFLGAELCRDPDWLRITQSYTVAGFEAARQLRYWPAPLRPLANRWLPACLTAQAMLREARAVMAPVLARRYAARAAAGDAYVESNDAMDWFATADPERALDAVSSQLALSFAAIHTTTDLLAETLLRIAQEPEVLAALREEIVEVHREDGWEKTALYKMKLLDGAIKETQRMKPISEVTMLRKVKETMTLSDGTRLRPGQKLGVTSTHFRSAALYSAPDAWDPRRWTRMREDPARQNAAHLVSTTPEHNAFGHGRHACPGRFFAANEIKVALLGILLRYDVEVPAGAAAPRVYEDGLTLTSDPRAVLRFRRREAEIDLDAACGEAMH